MGSYKLIEWILVKKKSEWVELKYSDGRTYYWNVYTQETVWQKPRNKPCMSYNDYVTQHMENLRMQDSLKRKEHKIKKLEGMMKCSKDVIKKCRKENKKKERKIR